MDRITLLRFFGHLELEAVVMQRFGESAGKYVAFTNVENCLEIASDRSGA